MSALLVLAGAFATIIAVGCLVVYLHDELARGHGRAVGGNDGGGRPRVAVWRAGRLRTPQATAGKIVWVRAGSNRVHRPAGSESTAGPNPNRH
ncbi:MAG TPA: hypothetical protein VFD39_07675 [Trueperaceae bacterium]|nr:hypothetical protein [Trueperaceae bacterium]